jgi:hypothetical protein
MPRYELPVAGRECGAASLVVRATIVPGRLSEFATLPLKIFHTPPSRL